MDDEQKAEAARVAAMKKAIQATGADLGIVVLFTGTKYSITTGYKKDGLAPIAEELANKIEATILRTPDLGGALE